MYDELNSCLEINKHYKCLDQGKDPLLLAVWGIKIWCRVLWILLILEKFSDAFIKYWIYSIKLIKQMNARKRIFISISSKYNHNTITNNSTMPIPRTSSFPLNSIINYLNFKFFPKIFLFFKRLKISSIKI